MAAENGVEAEGIQESGNNTENNSQETESSSPETSTAFHSKSPCEHCQNFNVYWILVMKCPKCFWHDYYKIVLYLIIGNYRSMKLTRIVKIRVNLSRVHFVER